MQYLVFAAAMAAVLGLCAIPFLLVSMFLEEDKGRFWAVAGICAYVQVPLCWLIWERFIPTVVTHPPGRIGELVFVTLFTLATLALAKFAWFMEHGFDC